MNEVKSYVTSDGKSFTDGDAAFTHEQGIKARALLEVAGLDAEKILQNQDAVLAAFKVANSKRRGRKAKEVAEVTEPVAAS